MDAKELNKWLAEKFMGWELINDHLLYEKDKFRYTKPEWNPHENISQAFECLEKIRPKTPFIIIESHITSSHKRWEVRLNLTLGSSSVSLPEAICNAIYKEIKGGQL